MGRFAGRFLALFGLCLLNACQLLDIREDCECGFYTTTAGKILAWPDGTQIDFQWHENFPENELESVKAATLAYEGLFSRTRIRIDSTHATAPGPREGQNLRSVSGDNVNGLYWVTGEWPWENDPDKAQADAVTLLRFSAQHGILEADIFFKAKSFSERERTPAKPASEVARAQASVQPLAPLRQAFRALSPTSHFAQYFPEPEEQSRGRQWLYLIAIHEFGHALGRNHESPGRSIMEPAVEIHKLDEPFSDFDQDSFSQVYTLSFD